MVATNDVYRMVFVSNTATKTCLNVQHYRINAVAGAGLTDKQIADGLTGAIKTDYLNSIAAAAKFQGVSVQRIRPAPLGAVTPPTPLNQAGALAGDLMATQTAGLISVRTALGGRKNRGRFYVPFPTEPENDAAGNPRALYVTQLDLLALALRTVALTVGADGVSMIHTIYHPSNDTWTDVTGYISRLKWATQRRRGALGKHIDPPF